MVSLSNERKSHSVTDGERVYRRLVEAHLELVEIEPSASFVGGQVVVMVAGGEAERVEAAVGRQQQRGRRLLVDDSRVAALPLAHHVDAGAASGRRRRRGGLVREAERVTAERRACDDNRPAEPV